MKKKKLVDGKTKEEVIIEYSPLVKYLARRLVLRLPSNIELDDLISVGIIGLMDAFDKYDQSRENKFKTYAEFRIRGGMLDELRSQDWVPRSIREKAKELERVILKLRKDKGREATDEEIRQEIGLNNKEFQKLVYDVRSVSLLSFDDIANISHSGKKSAIFSAEIEKSKTPFSEVDNTNVRNLVEKAISDLPEKQRLVLALYYYEDLNLKEIGNILEVTESRVSQLHTQAVLRLRARLKGKFEEFVQSHI